MSLWLSKCSQFVRGRLCPWLKLDRTSTLRLGLRPLASMAGESVDLECFLTKSFLNLDKVDENIYRSIVSWRPRLARGIYGGLIIGQALMAAVNTVLEDFHAHSFHCYFLRPGDAEEPMIYTVDRTNQGRTYGNRTVKAVQRGQAIFTMLASFKRDESDPFSHQVTMPDVPGPEELMCANDLVKESMERRGGAVEASLALASHLLEEEFPCEVRPISPREFIHSEDLPPRRLVWMRAVGHIGDDMNMHKCAAAYMSDMFLIDVARLPGPKLPPKMLASVDHSMWFHNSFHANEWMLFEAESPQTGGGKGLAVGRLWRRDGVLAVSVVQEGIVRTMNFSGKL